MVATPKRLRWPSRIGRIGRFEIAEAFWHRSVSVCLPDHEIEIRVRYYETDAQGFVHHANYFVYFEQARVEQLLALGYDYAHLERDGVLLVVNKIACKYHRPSRFGDTLTRADSHGTHAGARIDHEYRVLRGKELLAEGESTLACIDREGRVQRLPEFLVKPEGAERTV